MAGRLLVSFHLDFALREELASFPVERGSLVIDWEGETMPAGRILACEPDGPLGTNGPQRAIFFLRRISVEGEALSASYVVRLRT